MNRFPGPFLPRSTTRAMLVPSLRHWRTWLKCPEYRAWLRFNRQLGHRARCLPGVVNYCGRQIRFLDAASFLSAWHEIFVSGCYDLAPAQVGSTPLLVDGGANIGLAALRWKILFPQFRYVGFEPDPAAAAICRENLSAWDCNATLHPVALAASSGVRAFISDGADGGALAGGSKIPGTIEVRTARLSEFITEPADLVKVDVEGAEDDVICDLEPHLSLVRNLFVEVHSRRGEPQHWGRLVDRLQRAGFRCYVRPLLPWWRPFVDVSPGGAQFDEQFNVFAVRRDGESRG